MAPNEEEVARFRRALQDGEATLRGMPVLILHTTGRKSGLARANPTMYLRDRDNYIITASNNGRDFHPAWFLNLEATPQAEIEVPEGRLKANATIAAGAEKERLWAQLVAAAPFFQGYQDGTPVRYLWSF